MDMFCKMKKLFLTAALMLTCAINGVESTNTSQTTPVYKSSPAIAPNITNGYYINSSTIFFEWTVIYPTCWLGDKKKLLIKVVNESDNNVFSEEIIYGPFNYTVSNLDESTNYTVTMACVNENGIDSLSNPFKIQTDQKVISNPPTEIKFNVYPGNQTVYLSWTPPHDLPKTLYGYRIYTNLIIQNDKISLNDKKRKRDLSSLCNYLSDVSDNHTYTVLGNTTVFIFDNLYGYADYNISVAAFNKYPGVVSETIQLKTPEKTPLASAQCLRCLSATETAIKIGWKHAPMSLLQGIRSSYTIHYAKVSDGRIFYSSRYPHLESGDVFFLEPYTAYNFFLTANTSLGAGIETTSIECQTLESVPSVPPSNVVATSFESPTSSFITWIHIPASLWNGAQLGYKIWYQKLYSGEIFSDSPIETLTISYTNSFLLTKLNLYSTYRLQIAGQTNAGVGKKSNWVKFETCHVSTDTIYFDYFVFPPYVEPPLSAASRPNGLLIRVAEDAILSCSKFCRSFAKNISLVFNELSNMTFSGVSSYSESQMLVPRISPNIQNAYSKFLPIISSKHSVLLVMPTNESEKISQHEREFVNAVLYALPLFGLYAIINAVIGGIYFLLEPTKTGFQAHHFYWIRGIFGGFYSAIMISTTVGGRAPVTCRARLYALLWMSLAFIFTAVVVSHLSSSLIVFQISKMRRVYPTEKVIAVKKTPEYLYAVKNIISFETNESYSTYGELFYALLSKNIKYALVDKNVVNFYFNNLTKTNTEKIFMTENIFGMSLFGEYQLLYACASQRIGFLKKYSIFDSPEKIKTLNSSTIPRTKKKDDSPYINYRAPIYQLASFTSGGVLVAFILIGSIYDGIIYVKELMRRKRIATTLDKRLALQRELITISNEFCHDFVEMVKKVQYKTDTLLFRQKLDILHLRGETSKLYGVNFKYIKIQDLGVSLEELLQFKEEKKNLPKPGLIVRMMGPLKKKWIWIKIRADLIFGFISKNFL